MNKKNNKKLLNKKKAISDIDPDTLRHMDYILRGTTESLADDFINLYFNEVFRTAYWNALELQKPYFHDVESYENVVRQINQRAKHSLFELKSLYISWIPEEIKDRYDDLSQVGAITSFIDDFITNHITNYVDNNHKRKNNLFLMFKKSTVLRHIDFDMKVNLLCNYTSIWLYSKCMFLSLFTKFLDDILSSDELFRKSIEASTNYKNKMMEKEILWYCMQNYGKYYRKYIRNIITDNKINNIKGIHAYVKNTSLAYIKFLSVEIIINELMSKFNNLDSASNLISTTDIGEDGHPLPPAPPKT